jgi:hypothetical protein
MGHVVGMCRALLPVHNKVAGGVGDQSSPLAKIHPGEIFEFRPITAGHQFGGSRLSAHQGGSLTTQITRTIEPLREALTAALNYVSPSAQCSQGGDPLVDYSSPSLRARSTALCRSSAPNLRYSERC